MRFIKHEISNQFRKCDIVIEAKGFFEVNHRLLSSVCSMKIHENLCKININKLCFRLCCNYIIIFVQFDVALKL